MRSTLDGRASRDSARWWGESLVLGGQEDSDIERGGGGRERDQIVGEKMLFIYFVF